MKRRGRKECREAKGDMKEEQQCKNHQVKIQNLSQHRHLLLNSSDKSLSDISHICLSQIWRTYIGIGMLSGRTTFIYKQNIMQKTDAAGNL